MPDTLVSDGEQADKTFESATLPMPRAQREQRVATLSAQIKEWKAPEGFDDGSSKHPDPKQYYNGKPLALLDLEKLGIDMGKLGMKIETTER